jgi:Fe-S-cluster-containing hydrogenase component 2
MVCQQCEEAPCIAVCPVGALSIDEELARVVIDHDRCIKCKLCLTACPFGSMGYDTIGKKVIKCELCEGDPVCVRFCDPGAITYVDAGTANLRKARSVGERLQETLKKLSAKT